MPEEFWKRLALSLSSVWNEEGRRNFYSFGPRNGYRPLFLPEHRGSLQNAYVVSTTDNG